MQFLIKTTTHDTGEVFQDVVKARENEVFTLVDAESEDEAKEMIDGKEECSICGYENIISDYVYERNIPVVAIYNCINCKNTYTEYINEGDSE